MNESKDFESVRSLLTPSACYSSTTLRSFLRMSRRQSDDSLATALPRTGSCAEYVSNTLFPAWYARDYVIEYCQKVADNQQLPTEHALPESTTPSVQTHIDPRFDPYGARDETLVKSVPQDEVRDWVHQERTIEEIVRDNSAQFLARKCGFSFLKTSPTSSRLPVDSPTSYLQTYKSFQEFHKNNL